MIDLHKKYKKKNTNFHNDDKRPKLLYKKDLILVLLLFLVCSIGSSIVHSISPENYADVEHTHTGISCSSCHDPVSFDVLEEDPNDLCLDCHGVDGAVPVAENHGLGLKCTNCHSITNVEDTGDDDTGDDDTGSEDTGGEDDASPELTHPPVGSDADCSSCHTTSLTAHNTCTICHDVESETILSLQDKTVVEVEDSSIICAQCHEDEYSEWVAGFHVNNHESKICIECHSPHDPYVIIDTTLPPVDTMGGETEVPGPIIPPIIFFVAIIGALGYAVYAFVLRRG
jgi:hypothetical protein